MWILVISILFMGPTGLQTSEFRARNPIASQEQCMRDGVRSASELVSRAHDIQGIAFRCVPAQPAPPGQRQPRARSYSA